MIRALITLPRAIFACLLALGAGVIAFVATERSGDPGSVLTGVERKINEIDALIKWYTYELKEAGSPVGKSRTLYHFSGPKGELFFVEGPSGSDPSELKWLVDELYQKRNKRYVSYDWAWAEIEGAWSSLTWHNRRIAEARALRQFDSRPSGVSLSDWDNRFRGSEERWQVQESVTFQFQRVAYAVGAAGGAFVLVLLALALCGWLWRATLARIKEVSNAVRGR
jgi:hypothetical protein